MLTFEEFAAYDATLKEQIEALEHEREIRRTEFFEYYQGILETGQKYPAGNYIIGVQRNARFDPAQARRVLSDSDFEMILALKPDGAIAKKVLAPAVYEMTQREFAPKIVVTPVQDAA